MIVCHEHKFVFIEVPHTGSHSITAELTEHFPCQPILRKHSNLSLFLSQSSDEEKRYFKFATVRNPLDAAVTDYCRFEGNHKGQYTNPKVHTSNGGNVTDLHVEQFKFIYEGGASFPEFFAKYRDKIYHNWFLLGAPAFDYIIRFEDLQNGYKEVLKRLGLELPRELPHANPTAKKKAHYSEYYDRKSIELAVKNYGPFMKRWGYSFPESWNVDDEIPLVSQLKFNSLEFTLHNVSRLLPLDPDAIIVSSIKKFGDKIV